MKPGARLSVDFDAAVVGGGVVGATLAAILTGKGLRVAIIEKGEADRVGADGEYDLRVLALTRGSERVLRAVGAWRHIEAGRLGYVREMLVWDADGFGSIQFDSADICEPTLGYIVESGLIQASLETVLRDRPCVEWYRPAGLSGATWHDDKMALQLEDGRRLSARLLVGADGGDSRVRAIAEIPNQVHDYRQSALVCTVVTERPHGDIARQRFLTTGPLAFLPLADPQRCSIVWSTTPERARSLLALSDDAFRAALEQAFAAALGGILEVGPRAAWPLVRAHAESYVKPRLALIGDAAHRIHPLAGQGANLGLMDAATLAEVIIDAQAAGRDIGELRVLRRYERWRKGENLAMMTIMDAFKELFGTDVPPARWARNLGLNVADAAVPLKRWIMRRAMGLEGDLPRFVSAGRS